MALFNYSKGVNRVKIVHSRLGEDMDSKQSNGNAIPSSMDADAPEFYSGVRDFEFSSKNLNLLTG